MKNQIILNNQAIEYCIRKSPRSRYLRLSIRRDATVCVSAPESMPQSIIEKFLNEKAFWLIEKIAKFEKSKDSPLIKSSHKDYKLYKARALRLVKERLEHFNQFFGYEYKKITIRNQRSRWGSCARNGNLNFNYKIALLPPALADYVIVHELCHLGEFNHSKKFWALVGKVIPQYKYLAKTIRQL